VTFLYHIAVFIMLSVLLHNQQYTIFLTSSRTC